MSKIFHKAAKQLRANLCSFKYYIYINSNTKLHRQIEGIHGTMNVPLTGLWETLF